VLGFMLRVRVRVRVSIRVKIKVRFAAAFYPIAGQQDRSAGPQSAFSPWPMNDNQLTVFNSALSQDFIFKIVSTTVDYLIRWKAIT